MTGFPTLLPAKTRARIWTISAILICLLALCCAPIVMGLPVYTDEIGWKLIQARWLTDGNKAVIALPMCNRFELNIPFYTLPFRIFDSVLNSFNTTPLAIRVFGGVIAGLIVVLVPAVAFLSKFKADGIAKITILTCFAAGIGNMPFVLIMNRPEQIELYTLLTLALPIIIGSTIENKNTKYYVLSFLIITSCYALYCHPRAIFLLPLICTAYFYWADRRWVAAAASLATGAFGVATTLDWAQRITCKSEEYSDNLRYQNLLNALSDGKLHLYTQSMTAKINDDFARFTFVDRIRLDLSSTADMIPKIINPSIHDNQSAIDFLFFFVGIVGLAAFLIVAARDITRRSVQLRTLALLSLWTLYFASVLTRINRETYEEALIVPTVLLASFGSLWAGRSFFAERYGREAVRVAYLAGLTLVGVATAVSLATILVYFQPPVTKAWARPGYTPGQRFSVNTSGYATLRKDIIETAAMCGVRTDGHSQRVIVDELTYYPMSRTREPFLATYIYERGWGEQISDYRAFLSRIGSDGMVVGCQWVPTPLRPLARHHGDFCCIESFRSTGASPELR
jgi:hypothetical protein